MKFVQSKSDAFVNIACYCIVVVGLLAVLGLTTASQAGPVPITTCDMAGIGSTSLTADVAGVQILSAAPATTTSGTTTVPYCLVKVLVPEAINIWVGLPTGGAWNQRLQSVGGGGYAGSVSAPTSAVIGGYVGITTDTGHTGSSGSFGMIPPVPPATIGTPNIPLQVDFSYRSEHMMAVIGKQLTNAFYGPNLLLYSYWNGCSTGGRQGLAMAQRYPEDYNGILAGAPAIHFDRFQAEQIWPQMVQFRDAGYVVSTAKKTLATNAAIAVCDALDGVVDGLLTDPRECTYDARNLVTQTCTSSDATCLTPQEASAINKIWFGATNQSGSRFLWYGQTRGTNLDGLGGATPFSISVNQPRYWVYFDPAWDWHVLDYSNYESFFDYTVSQMTESGTATNNPNLAPFRDHGSKLIMWHGFADQLIMPEGTIDYYTRVVNTLGGYSQVQGFARLFMAPNVAHCGGGAGPSPQNIFNYVVDWVEKGKAPDTILAAHTTTVGGVSTIDRTRPLCPYPTVAVWTGHGSTDDAANFVCSAQPRECKVAAFQALGLKDEKFQKPVTIESAAIVPAAGGVPEYCDVVGSMWPTIRFEVALPTTEWNERLLMAGNGGTAGTISKGTLTSSLLNSGGIIPALKLGYAATSTDTGHCAGSSCPAGLNFPGNTFADPNYPTSGANPWAYQKYEDFAYRSVHETIVVAKKMVNAYYKKMPVHTYWVGCSTGGRQGLMEAQRYPADFDGISVGAPVNNFVGQSMLCPEQLQPQYTPGCDISTFCGGPQIPPANIPYLGSVVYGKCDGLDGLVDGLIDDPRKCKIDVDKDLAKCPSDSYVPYTTQPNNCFTSAQLGAIKKIYAGGFTSTGKQVIAGTQTGAEVFQGGWNPWLVGTRLNGTSRWNVANGSFGYFLFDPQQVSFNVLSDWSWDTSPARIGVDRADMINATDADLTEFYYRRGKIIMFVGWADPSANPLVNALPYYQRVMNAMPQARPFFAFYMIPGMGHCSGGIGCDKVDFLTPLVNWVEKGIEPDALIGTASSGTPRTRPICRYPEVARYSGSGSIDDAANFMCVPPIEVSIAPKSLSLTRTDTFEASISMPKGFEAKDWGISGVICNGASATGAYIPDSFYGPTYVAIFRAKDLMGVSPGNAVPFTVNLTFHNGGNQALTQATATVQVVP